MKKVLTMLLALMPATALGHVGDATHMHPQEVNIIVMLVAGMFLVGLGLAIRRYQKKR